MPKSVGTLQTNPRGTTADQPPCACRPGVGLCPVARDLSHRLSEAYGRAKATGDWRSYDVLRDEAEAHVAHLQRRED